MIALAYDMRGHEFKVTADFSRGSFSLVIGEKMGSAKTRKFFEAKVGIIHLFPSRKSLIGEPSTLPPFSCMHAHMPPLLCAHARTPTNPSPSA